MTETVCQQCAHPTDAYLCPRCTDKAGQDVARLPWLAGQCRVQSHGLGATALAPRTSGTPSVHRAPNMGARDLARECDQEHEWRKGWDWGRDPDAALTWGRVRSLCARAVSTINPGAPRWYLGACCGRGDTPRPDGAMTECWADLWARPGGVSVTCRECGREHDVPARRAVLLGMLEDQLVSESDLISAAPALLGEALARGRFQVWRARGLEVRGLDRNHQRMYRVGDVWDRVARAAVNRSVSTT